MPEFLNLWRSAEVKLSGFENHFEPFEGLMAKGLSMSITVARFINSIARDEYSTGEEANK